MAYYLTDPYYYLPKSYPFIGRKWQSLEKQAENRLSQLGKKIQQFSASQRLNYSAKSFCDKAKCEENLMRCKYKLNEIQNPQNMAHVLTSRSQKQACLRKKSRNFASFVESQQIMEEYMDKKF